jgi:hypothetical protein
MIRAVTLCAALASPLAAQDFIVTDGPLSDHDFYHLVACSADPAGPCREEIVRWSASDAANLTFAIATPTNGFPKWLRTAVTDSTIRAAHEISASSPHLNLRRIQKPTNADIIIYPQNIRAHDRILPIGRAGVDNEPIGAAHVQIWWNSRKEITEAAIVLAADIPPDQVYPIILEELTQSLGLLTDIRNPYYETRSVFSEDSNAVQKLGTQDIVALRSHYQP